MIHLKPGMWYAICCIHDLRQITAEDDLKDLQEGIEEWGARAWTNLESALADLREEPWTDEERAIADRLRAQG
jgi:hypothetical protein